MGSRGGIDRVARLFDLQGLVCGLGLVAWFQGMDLEL